MASTVNNTGNGYNFKIVLLGEGCVGKTSVLLRYVEDKFNDNHLSTVQASFLNKKLNIDGKRVTLSIWDTAGQEIFHALGPIYYRMSNGAVLVYDITDQKTFQKVKNWVKELKKMLGNEVCLVIAGNKIDLEKDRNVSIEEAEEYARQVGATHFYTSAKLNQNIEELFLDITYRMIQHTDTAAEQKSTLCRTNSTRRNVLVVEDDTVREQTTKKSCCGSSS
ncbi:ras-related protein Rab-21 [Prorops nasuta]|uniref:ras-related protein Rab-21 n=1 Tax=Prorops nasuta TaxID=863751 RepID=UPI0034CFEE07